MLPDWNSIESTTRWSEGLFWTGIAALVVVAVTELAAHIYSHRAAYLVSERARIESQTEQRRERETEQRLSAETANIREKLDTANAEVKQLQSESVSRHLFEQQKNDLVKALSPFAGQKIKVWCSPSAPDSVALGREFIAVLKRAGWNVPGEVFRGPVPGANLTGLQVAFEGDLSDSSQIPAGIDALITALEQFGLISSQTLFLDDRAHSGDYLLKIGRAPAAK